LLERIVYIVPFLFIGVISFFIGSSFEKEKEILLASVLMILIFYMLVNFYMVKLVADGKINPYIYPVIITGFFTMVSLFVYKKS